MAPPKPEDPCAPPPNKPKQQDTYSASLDACLADGVIKTGASVLLGGLASILFFKRRRWPVIASMGTGIGLAWANCENDLNKAMEAEEKDKNKKKK